MNHKSQRIGALFLSILSSTSAFATDGYFSHGIGVKAQGIGGVGIALPQDGLAAASNPAGTAWVGDRLDAGLVWFAPKRSSEIVGNAVPGASGDYDGNDSAHFFIPEIGYTKQLSPTTAVGIAIYGNIARNSPGDFMQNQTTPAVFGLIGNTPVVEVTRIDTGPCRLFLKLESQNPGGSIKDRVGLAMIEAAEADGRLKPGGVVVEATAGNTGLGLALVARVKGYRIVLVVPDKMSTEKILHLKALGAEVHLTRSDVAKGHPEYYQDYAARLASELPGAFFADQFNNPANPLAHETTTAPEIWAQCGHRLDAIVVGVGSSGTLTGLTRFFRRVQPALEFVLADPQGSILADYVKTGRVAETSGSWAVEGIGEDFIPAIADLSGVRHAYTIDDEESFACARILLREEGLLGGSSSGTLLAAALRYCRAQSTPKRVLSFVCDTGTRYLSKLYNDGWMIDQGLLKRHLFDDLRDLIGRRFDDGDVISVSPSDTLMTAFNRMRSADLSQLPVIDKGRLAGIVDESDVLLNVAATPSGFHGLVGGTMTTRIETLQPDASLQQLRATLERGLVAVIADNTRFYGLITRFDLLNHLRRTLP